MKPSTLKNKIKNYFALPTYTKLITDFIFKVSELDYHSHCLARKVDEKTINTWAQKAQLYGMKRMGFWEMMNIGEVT